MALPFRSIFGLADESGSNFDPGLATDEQDRAPWLASGAASGRGTDGMFTIEAESLSEAIPVELRSGAATHSSKVTLRLEDAEWEPGDMEVTTRLVQIYRSCPQLFTVAIDGALDMPVRLRLAGGVEPALTGPPPVPASGVTNPPSVIGLPAASEMANPFRAVAAGTVAAQVPMNPFSSPLVKPMDLPSGPPPLPAGAVSSPFTVAPAGPGTPTLQSGSQISPFLAAITGAPIATPTPPSLPPIAREIPPKEETVAQPELRLSFPFHVLLGQIDPAVLGINPSALPLDWKTHLPWSYVKPQFAGGRVVALLSKLIEHADAPAKVGLQGVNGGIEVAIPLKEIVRQLPSSEILPGPAAIAAEEKAAVNPFISQAKEEAKRGFVPLKEAPPAMLDPTAPVLSPFRIAPEASPVHAPVLDSNAPAKLGKGLDSLDDLKGATLDFAKPSLPVVPAAAHSVFASVPAPAPSVPPTATPPIQAAAPVPPVAPRVPGTGEGGWLRFDGVGVQPPVRDLELRAVFGRSEAFTRQLAVDLTAAMPGVLGCVLFSSSEAAEVLAESGALSPEAQALVSRMPRMYQRIQGLAEDLGFESGETFTLRTSQGLVSFFSEGNVCLSVLQASEKNDAGFWERLVLIARGMASLRE